MTDHVPKPIVELTNTPISLCTCGEKLRRTADGWEHFGEDTPYETYTIGGPAPRKWQVIIPVLVCVQAEDFAEACVKADKLIEKRQLYPFTHPGERTSDVSEADPDAPLDWDIVYRAW